MQDGWWLFLPTTPPDGDKPMSGRAAPALTWRRGGFARCFLVLLTVVALGDFLSFDQRPGLGLALWALSLTAAGWACATQRPTRNRTMLAWALGSAAQIPWLLAPGILSFCFMLAGPAAAVALLTVGATPSWRLALAILSSTSWRMIPDLLHAWRHRPPMAAGRFSLASWLSWLVPVLGGALFLTLFADANPLIAAWLAHANPVHLLSNIPLGRVLFWLLLAMVAWPFLQVPKVKPRALIAGRAVSRTDAILFGPLAIRRALILFNALFTLQTGLDAAYLWAGLRLPSGFTYADYAHRGAYPLILTALLAGGFAILATRPGTPAAASRSIRLLVLAWVVQNLALVADSIYRLDLYVQTYSLSELRLAAFIWMLLVFAGLMLIILRIVLARSDAWLLRGNLLAALVTVYAACCLNMPWIVAHYDVTHCREITGSGAALDLDYIQSLGPQAIPALDRYEQLTAENEPGPFTQQGQAGAIRNTLASNFETPSDWRGFSFWSWVLHFYLVTHEPVH
jgi:hypothetical protein